LARLPGAPSKVAEYLFHPKKNRRSSRVGEGQMGKLISAAIVAVTLVLYLGHPDRVEQILAGIAIGVGILTGLVSAIIASIIIRK
jgi:hypothetical protein